MIANVANNYSRTMSAYTESRGWNRRVAQYIDAMSSLPQNRGYSQLSAGEFWELASDFIRRNRTRG